jgi:threonylcarbamoyladenosine tRNA methylthiotransferase MtaB
MRVANSAASMLQPYNEDTMAAAMRVFLSNLGCKVNQAEVDSMARRFRTGGHEIVGSLIEADLHVVNSCTVTHAAARDSRKTVRRGGRLGSEMKTVVTGCWASEPSSEAPTLDGVDLVVHNSRKEELVEIVQQRWGESGIKAPPAAVPVSFVPLAFGPTRGLVKVEDGCNMTCSFCIIPSTRGSQRSRSIPEVVAEVRSLAEGGYSEVVVTGVQISSYRWHDLRLYDLLQALLRETDVSRLRLTSIAPWEVDDRLFELLHHPRICRHFHFSLQSGCTETLRRMRRPYSAGQFGALVQRARSEVPGVAITTDVIAGFPGETEREFEDSLAFVRQMEFARVHVFPYSPRAGTRAALLDNPVSDGERKQRASRLRTVGAEAECAFRDANLGDVLSVLWEERRARRWRGMSDNYVRVFVDSDSELRGTITATRLIARCEDGVLGATVEDVRCT